MKLVTPSAEEATAGLRALATIAAVDGSVTGEELAVLEAAQSVLGGERDLANLAPITPRELSIALQRPEIAKQLVGAMIVMAGSASVVVTDDSNYPCMNIGSVVDVNGTSSYVWLSGPENELA